MWLAQVRHIQDGYMPCQSALHSGVSGCTVLLKQMLLFLFHDGNSKTVLETYLNGFENLRYFGPVKSFLFICVFNGDNPSSPLPLLRTHTLKTPDLPCKTVKPYLRLDHLNWAPAPHDPASLGRGPQFPREGPGGVEEGVQLSSGFSHHPAF